MGKITTIDKYKNLEEENAKLKKAVEALNQRVNKYISDQQVLIIQKETLFQAIQYRPKG